MANCTQSCTVIDHNAEGSLTSNCISNTVIGREEDAGEQSTSEEWQSFHRFSKTNDKLVCIFCRMDGDNLHLLIKTEDEGNIIARHKIFEKGLTTYTFGKKQSKRNLVLGVISSEAGRLKQALYTIKITHPYELEKIGDLATEDYSHYSVNDAMFVYATKKTDYAIFHALLLESKMQIRIRFQQSSSNPLFVLSCENVIYRHISSLARVFLQWTTLDFDTSKKVPALDLRLTKKEKVFFLGEYEGLIVVGIGPKQPRDIPEIRLLMYRHNSDVPRLLHSKNITKTHDSPSMVINTCGILVLLQKHQLMFIDLSRADVEHSISMSPKENLVDVIRMAPGQYNVITKEIDTDTTQNSTWRSSVCFHSQHVPKGIKSSFKTEDIKCDYVVGSDGLFRILTKTCSIMKVWDWK